MSEFIAGLLGVVVGGLLSLLGVWLTLKKQVERDAKDDQRRIRDAFLSRIDKASPETAS